jgi:UDP-GlcNAc:undecaprenyl-phosphate/decaprenyl-phosphate GlcNAc-1-phosphate transferase
MTLTLLYFAAAALVASAAITPLLKRVATRAGLVAHPSQDRWHRSAVPLAGGVAIVGACLGVPAAANQIAGLTVLVVCSLAMSTLGLADDVWRLRPATKFVAQVAIAAVFVSFAPPLELTGVRLVDTSIALAWVIGITNAFNLLDNVDGLAAGVACIAAAFYLSVWPTGAESLPVLLAAFIGATLGFLLYNFQPASIFMGDSGSLFLGFFLAAAALLLGPGEGASTAAIPVLILLVPIFDTTFVTLTRVMGGRSPIAGGRDHTSHRLIALGIDERRAVLVHYGLTAAGGVIALGVSRIDSSYIGIALGLYAISLAALGIVLGHVEGAHTRADAGRPTPPILSEISYRNRALEVLLDAALVGLAYYAAYAIRFRGDDFAHFLPYFGRSLPLVLICQIAGLWTSGKYRQVWRSFGAAELTTILRGVALGVAVSVVTVLYVYRFEGFSRLVFLVDGFILAALLIGARVAVNRLDDYLLRQRGVDRQVLVYGAGRRGALLVRDLLRSSRFNLAPIGFLDDDPAKRRLTIEGLRVLGGISELEAVLTKHRLSEVVVSTDRVDASRLQTIEAVCGSRNVRVRRLHLTLDVVASGEQREMARHG